MLPQGVLPRCFVSVVRKTSRFLSSFARRRIPPSRLPPSMFTGQHFVNTISLTAVYSWGGRCGSTSGRQRSNLLRCPVAPSPNRHRHGKPSRASVPQADLSRGRSMPCRNRVGSKIPNVGCVPQFRSDEIIHFVGFRRSFLYPRSRQISQKS